MYFMFHENLFKNRFTRLEEGQGTIEQSASAIKR